VPETHIVMSSLIFCLILPLVLCLAHLLKLCLVSLIDLIITHMVLVHERITLCPDPLVTANVLRMVIEPRVGMVFLLEGLTPALSLVHIFSVVVLIPLVQG
jgi:hypothetical protein